MDIYRDYIDAAHDMYDKYRVGADTRAVDTLDYSDPISGKTQVLKIYWQLKAGRSGPGRSSSTRRVTTPSGRSESASKNPSRSAPTWWWRSRARPAREHC